MKNVSELSVADIRRSLGQLRIIWSNHSPSTPICITQELEVGMNISEFCFTFLMNHHSKRLVKESASSQ
jgi:hypothetical protein